MTKVSFHTHRRTFKSKERALLLLSSYGRNLCHDQFDRYPHYFFLIDFKINILTAESILTSLNNVYLKILVLGGGGGRTQEEGIGMSTVQKGAIF